MIYSVISPWFVRDLFCDLFRGLSVVCIFSHATIPGEIPRRNSIKVLAPRFHPTFPHHDSIHISKPGFNPKLPS
jgi:hypothetical protein